ncbi:MAG: flagellin lysine-N-methylase [Alphaproteobacteria bacterium]|nr:flagellin lysine-N-methylase [Alphaproteobacteria bacterium]
MKALSAVSAFRCLGAECADTCCQGWAMQIEPATEERYRKEAPDLLESVTGPAGQRHMKRNPDTDFCVRYEGGLCGIQKQHGEAFLGDACFFYPRILRRAGEMPLMSASLSCPEIARLALREGLLSYQDVPEPPRMPQEMRSYAEPDMDGAAMMALHEALVAWALARPAEEALLDFALFAEHWERDRSAAFTRDTIMTLRSSAPKAEKLAVDAYRLAHCLSVLILASRRKAPPRLERIEQDILEELKVGVNPETFMIENKAQDFSAAQKLEAGWRAHKEVMAPVMSRWLAAQVSASFFPFGGLGAGAYERAVLLALKFAIFRLGLMAHAGKTSEANVDEAARVAQGLSRFMDHLADPALSMALYKDAGWTQLSRLRGLLASG